MNNEVKEEWPVPIEGLNHSCPYLEEKCKDIGCDCPKYKAYIAVQDEEKVANKIKELGFDMEMDTWELLMGMQKGFAAKFHKVDDLSKEEIEHWIDKYLICIVDEVDEAREHLDIYPGVVKTESNINELKKEIIDILHFLMDEFICGNATASDIEKKYLEMYHNPENETPADFLEYAFSRKEAHINEIYADHSFDMKMLLLLNQLLDANRLVRQQISWKHWKKPNETINQDKLMEAFVLSFRALIDLFIGVGMNAQDVKDVYVYKNLENIFRQEFGY